VRFVDANDEQCDGTPALIDADLVGERKSAAGDTWPVPSLPSPQERPAYVCGEPARPE